MLGTHFQSGKVQYFNKFNVILKERNPYPTAIQFDTLQAIYDGLLLVEKGRGWVGMIQLEQFNVLLTN